MREDEKTMVCLVAKGRLRRWQSANILEGDYWGKGAISEAENNTDTQSNGWFQMNLKLISTGNERMVADRT